MNSRAWSEGGVFQSSLGVETAVFGPGDLAQADSSDEFVQLGDLCASGSIYAHALRAVRTNLHP